LRTAIDVRSVTGYSSLERSYWRLARPLVLVLKQCDRLRAPDNTPITKQYTINRTRSTSKPPVCDSAAFLQTPRFLKDLPVVAVPDATAAVFAAGAFFVVADLIVLMTVFFGADRVVAALAVVVFMTVPVLASLDSLISLIFFLPRVVAGGGAGRAGFLTLGAVPPALELVDEEAVVLRAAAAPRAPLAFSTMLLNKFDEDFVVRFLVGDAGLATCGLVGEAGRWIARGLIRALVEAGDNTWL
jgi:hypothetical protein